MGKHVLIEGYFYHLFTEQYMQLSFIGCSVKCTTLELYRLPIFSLNQSPEGKEYFTLFPLQEAENTDSQACLVEWQAAFKKKEEQNKSSVP